MRLVPLAEARTYPIWRQPVFLLFLMAAAMPLSFATWSALINNWVIEAAGFTGVEIGWLHTVREIPGFLAIGVIAVIIFVAALLGFLKQRKAEGGGGRELLPFFHAAGGLALVNMALAVFW